MRRFETQQNTDLDKESVAKETKVKAETGFARLFKVAKLARKVLAKLLPNKNEARAETEQARLFNEAELARKALASKALANKNKAKTKQTGLSKDAESPKQLVPQKEVNPYLSARQDDCVIAAFKQYGVRSLWHMTHIKNVQSIINKGILSHSDAHKKTSAVDISNNEVNIRRERREPLFGRKIHNYAPLYINIKNPMLYVKKDIRNELCLLEISLSVLDEKSYIYTDGNAAANATRFFHGANNVKNLPWEVLNANYWNDIPDGKRKRCAEVLVLDNIEPRHIKAIHCYSTDTAEMLSSRNIRASVSQQFFF